MCVVWGLGFLVYAGCAQQKRMPSGATHDGNVREDGGPQNDAAPRSDGGLGSDGADRVRGDSGKDANGEAGCVPQAGPDLPDEDFADTNCDGIDGDASRAIFVSPAGLDGNPGTMNAPMQTIQKAIAKAASSGKTSVYVCDATYPENVLVVQDLVSLYGGYECDNHWRRGSGVASIAPTLGIPMTIQNVQRAMTLSHLSLQAPSTTELDASSIAAVVIASQQILFSHSDLIAGNAGPGSPGTPVADPLWTQQAMAADSAAVGADACYTESTGCKDFLSGTTQCASYGAGATGAPRYCYSGLFTIQGGAGGHGGNCTQSVLAEPGHPGLPATPSAGARGQDGGDGPPAWLGFGTLVNGRYVNSNWGGSGQMGAPGAAGLGGAGGSSTSYSTGVFHVGSGGGQGGYPGCPGTGGEGGHGGGASIGVLVDQAVVSIEQCQITTGTGGLGGAPSRGAPGQRGGLGGAGATGAYTNAGGRGQTGGDGGTGGSGGPGGGGPSVGIVYTGIAPVISGTTFALGAAGTGATFGMVKGADGARADVYTPDTADGGQ